MDFSFDPNEVRHHPDKATRGRTFEIDEAQERRDLEEMDLGKAALLLRPLVQTAAWRCEACQNAHEQGVSR
ncbi:hypothetical protein AQB9606_04471 [Aquabacterium sp. CECT 9606]|nr:hypothetical protein AQB9606_04471 [Aquabacterium sp. CECT 9606]